MRLKTPSRRLGLMIRTVRRLTLVMLVGEALTANAFLFSRWSSLGLRWQRPTAWSLWQYYQTHESTDDAYVVGDIVPVSPRVAGTVFYPFMWRIISGSRLGSF